MKVSTIKNIIFGLKDDDEIHFVEYDDGIEVRNMIMTDETLRGEAEESMLRDGVDEGEIARQVASIDNVINYLENRHNYIIQDNWF